MKSSKYFEEAFNEVNEEFLGADDWGSADGDWESADDDDYEYADDWENADDEFGGLMNASGKKKGGQGAAQAQPYIIIVKNTSTADIDDVVILNAASAQVATAPAYSNTAGIDISYGLSNITYKEFLATISSGQAFEVGQLRLVASASSSSVAESQVLTAVAINTKDINGNEANKTLIPQKDSYQQINNQVDLYHKFAVNQLTKITFDSMATGVTLKVYLYPSAKVNQFAALKGKKPNVKFGNPKTDRALARR